jgi:hypothetical protein
MKTFYEAAWTRSIRNKGLALLLANFTILSVGRSQTAGNWNFSNTLSGTPGSSITVSNFSLGPSIVSGAYNGGTEYFGENGWPAGALDPNAYTQFSLTAATGYYLVLNTIYLVQRHSSTGTAAGSGPNNWSIRSSLDNYATDITSGTMTPVYVTYTVNLPAAFQAIPSTVTFRVYGYNATVTSGGINRFVFDNISVQGQAVSGILAEQSIHLTANTSAQNSIALQWQADGFAAGTDFTLERSVNGADFTPVRQQNFTGNNTVFQYEDAAAPNSATLFYRVAASELDGTSYYSPIVSVKQEVVKTKNAQIRGVITQGSSIKTLLHIEETGTYQLSVWSQDGRALSRQMVQESAGDPMADISLGAYPHGVYILTISKDGQNSARQFVY